MLKEFKEFISRGSAIELAIGVIMGGTFSAIINSLVDDILMPIIGMFIGVNFSELVIVVNGSPLNVGLFIQAVVNFLIISFILFMIVKGLNKLKKPEEVVDEVVVESEDIVLLREIRDALNK